MLRVADFPRPPAIERENRRITITLGGVMVADTVASWRVLETFHPPTYYLPEESFIPGSLVPAGGSSFCEWKGAAAYVTVQGGGRVAAAAGWTYPAPSPAYAGLRGHVAVYAGRMDCCTVGGDRVVPQPGGFYGGWITPDLEGPFKGPPGTEWW